MLHFGFFSLVLVAVYWVNRALGLFDRLIAGGSNLATFLEFTALALPNVIVAVLPVSALVAALYGLNRLAADSELVVAQTTGLSPWRLARPVLAFGLVVAAMVSVLGHALVPMSRTALSERGEALSRDVTARFLREGEFLEPGDGVTVYVREITEQGELLGLFLQDRRSPEIRTAYTAERAVLVRAAGGTRLVMFDGMAQSLQVADRSLLTTTFDDFAYDLAGLAGTDGRSRRDPREMSTPALAARGRRDAGAHRRGRADAASGGAFALRRRARGPRAAAAGARLPAHRRLSRASACGGRWSRRSGPRCCCGWPPTWPRPRCAPAARRAWAIYAARARHASRSAPRSSGAAPGPVRPAGAAA